LIGGEKGRRRGGSTHQLTPLHAFCIWTGIAVVAAVVAAAAVVVAVALGRRRPRFNGGGHRCLLFFFSYFLLLPLVSVPLDGLFLARFNWKNHGKSEMKTMRQTFSGVFQAVCSRRTNKLITLITSHKLNGQRTHTHPHTNGPTRDAEQRTHTRLADE